MNWQSFSTTFTVTLSKPKAQERIMRWYYIISLRMWLWQTDEVLNVKDL